MINNYKNIDVDNLKDVTFELNKKQILYFKKKIYKNSRNIYVDNSKDLIKLSSADLFIFLKKNNNSNP